MPRKNGGVAGGRVSVSGSSASGIWDLNDQQQNTSAWPIMVVPKLWNSFALRWTTQVGLVAGPGTQAQYAAAAGAVIPSTAGYVFNSGYHYFDITEGNYTVSIRGAEGSGTQHGYGAIITASMTVVTTTRMVAIVGNPGSGLYSGGGMSALALRNAASDIYTSAIPILVAGGGGGGYSTLNSEADAGGTNWTSITRRGIGGIYDGGASFFNNYNPELYNNTTGGQGSNAAQHWVWGSRGGIATACGGGTSQGGFGGGGGSCPAGGGGYYGGRAGGEGPSRGGGGGTSYRLASGAVAFISAWSDAGTNGSTRTANPGTAGGELTITAVA